jgi:predicted peptidase
MTRRVAILFFGFAIVPLTQVVSQTRERPGAAVSEKTLELYEPGEYRGLKYRLMKPIDFDPAKSYPLIVSLHGGGGRGTDNVRNVRNWNEYMAAESLRRKHPCFVLAPQSDASWNDPTSAHGAPPDLTDQDIAALPEAWRSRVRRRPERFGKAPFGNLHLVLDLIDNKLSKEFKIDADRCYCLGHSMGGFGTFTAVYQHPNRFAAAIPTAGGFYPWRDASQIKDVPIWTFHGSADNTIPADFTRVVFRKMQELGGNMKYTELLDVGHGANSIAFKYTGDDPTRGYVTHYASDRPDKTPDVWDWLFRQKLSDRE